MLALGGIRTRWSRSAPALLLIDLYRAVFGDRPQPLLEAIKEWPGS
jgi:maleamate amidohydrolase